METLVCSRCGSTNLEALDDGRYKCTFCGTIIVPSHLTTGLVNIILVHAGEQIDEVAAILDEIAEYDDSLETVSLAPSLILEGATLAEAIFIKERLAKSGATVELQPNTSRQVDEIITPEAPVPCPRCKQSYAVQRVSTIYKYSSHKSSLNEGLYHTELGEKLALPGGPDTSGLGLNIWFILLIVWVVLAALLLVIFVNIERIQLGNIFLSGIVADLIITTIIVFLLFFLIKNWDTKQKKAQMDKLPKWQPAMKKWKELYYCPRCDGVFLPGQNRLTVLDDDFNMEALLYEQG